MICVEIMYETDVEIGKMQTYNMEDQYESVNIGDFDVVRSTQFVDDLSRGVHVSYHFGIGVGQPCSMPF